MSLDAWEMKSKCGGEGGVGNSEETRLMHEQEGIGMVCYTVVTICLKGRYENTLVSRHC